MRWRRKRKSDGINERWDADMAYIADVKANPDLSPEDKFRLIEQTMMRNNGGKPHGLRNVWTGPGEPPSGFGYYDVYGRRNR